MIIEHKGKNSNGIYKRMDLSNIPKKLYGSRVVMDWKEAQNSTVEFIYGEISGTAMLNYTHTTESSHNNKTHHFDFTFENKTISIDSKSLYKVSIGALFSKKTPEWAINFLVNEEDKNLSGASSKKVLCRCPECKLEKFVVFHSLCKKGLYCPNCHSTESMPERTVRTILEQNNLAYTQEYSHPELSHRKFDFYLIGKNIMLEVHGEHHYRASFGEDAFLETTTSDEEKRSFCRAEKAPLIEIDCTNTSANSIVSKLTKELSVTLDREFDFESTVAFVQQQLHLRYATPSNLYIKENYKKGEPIDKIAQALNVSESTIRNRLGDMGIPIKARGRKVVETNHGMVFYSLTEAAIFGGASVNAVYLCCANKQRTAGEHPQTSSPLSWEYYEEYREKSKHKVLIECRIHQEEGNYSA